MMTASTGDREMTYDPNKTHFIRLPTEADGFTKAEIEAIIAKRADRRIKGTTAVGD